MNKYNHLDFEYHGTTERNLKVVCCSLTIENGDEVTQEEFWLYGGDHAAFRTRISELKLEGYVFTSWNVEAEASALYSMGINPLEFEWIDQYLEYKMLQNHNDELLYGNQYIDGKIVKCRKYGQKGKASLSAGVYKLTGHQIDTGHKTQMRDIIIRGNPVEIEENQFAIQTYCTSDTTFLPHTLKAIKKHYKKLVPAKELGKLKAEAKWRAEYACRSAIMVRGGYPINVQWTRNLTDAVPLIIRDCQEDINSQFPDILPFKWSRKDLRYTLDTKACIAWVRANHDQWARTDTGNISLALESWEDHYNYRHEFPRGNFGAQMVRYFKMQQSLRSFNFKSGADIEDTFWGFVGSDGFVRPYMNIYGAQSSRSQPKSKGFLFLKSAWVRSLCQAPEGYAIGAIDFASQEILLGAVLSGDEKLFNAYASGDVYLAYGKEIGVIPPDGTKQSHSKERDDQKPVLLGWQYWITGFGLSSQLKAQTGRHWEPEEAQELLNQLDETYSTFAEFRNKTIDFYRAYRYLKLVDGWYMWGDNDNDRSAANMVVQGTGAAIMRKAVQLAQDAGLRVIFTLHDALYIMFKQDDHEAMATLRRCMYEATIFFFEGKQKEWASAIRCDGKAWSNSYQDGKITTKDNFVFETSKYHVDKRALVEYNLFSKYFLNTSGIDLL